MKIALVNVPNNSNFSMNKDLVGGLGQTWEVGNSIFSKIISQIRKNSVNLPILSLANIQAILKNKNIDVRYLESIPNKEFDIFLVYGSMIDYKNENNFVKKIKKRFPKSKIGFIGPFPTKYPEYFNSDFIIIGEPESFFLYQSYEKKTDYNGLIKVKKLVNMDDLPTPNFDGFPIKRYNYFPALNKKPVLTLQASRGCPFSCSYYCAYGAYQGNRYRKRSPEKILDDIKILIKKYNMRSLQFRDATFGIDKKQIIDLCDLIIKNRAKVNWGIETRMDLLNKKVIKVMFNAGLRNINVGIESVNEKIASLNKRKLTEIKHQEEIINFCKKLGVKVSAFYIMGYEGDNEENIKKLIDYAIKLNTNGARFAIETPFPGTAFFEKLKKEKRLKSLNFNDYNSFSLVFDHENLSAEKLLELKELAFRKYYFRLSYALEFLKWKIKEFWL